jgi:hypothetical protein
LLKSRHENIFWNSGIAIRTADLLKLIVFSSGLKKPNRVILYLYRLSFLQILLGHNEKPLLMDLWKGHGLIVGFCHSTTLKSHSNKWSKQTKLSFQNLHRLFWCGGFYSFNFSS